MNAIHAPSWLQKSLSILAFLAASPITYAQEQSTPPHAATTIPALARYEIVQSQLAAKWTFRLDRVCGHVGQLVKTKSDAVTWENMSVIGLPNCSADGKVRYQIFSSGLAARHTFLMNLDTGKTWILFSIKDEKLGEISAWTPFAE